MFTYLFKNSSGDLNHYAFHIKRNLNKGEYSEIKISNKKHHD